MTPFQTRYYNFWTRLVNSKKYVRTYDIDFNKPFWQYLLNVKAHILVCILDLISIYVFNPIFVIFISKAIIERDLNQFVFWGIAKILQHFVVLALGRSFVYLYDITETSFRKNVQTKLLQLDPINFTTKSSGEIVAKFERTVAAIHSFNSSLFELIIPFVFSIIVAVVVVAKINLIFGAMFAIFFILLCAANVWLVRNNNDIFFD
jgi:ABC-type multidrug transport system fused ATPase/permease subunit